MTTLVRSLHTRQVVARGSLLVATLAVVTSLVAGVAVVRQDRASLFVLAALVVGALLALLIRLRWAVLLAWPLAGAVTYPFVRFPSGHPILTFDRIWLPALAVIVAAERASWVRTTSRFALTFWTFAAVTAIRAAITPSGRLGALEMTLDAIILPLLLFLAARGYARSVGTARRLAGALTLAGAALALIGIGESLFGFELATRVHSTVRYDAAIDLVRVSGPYGVPEPYALSLLLCLAATLYWLQTGEAVAFIAGLGVAALECIAIWITYFRAAWIAGVIILVAAVGIRPGRRVRLITVLVVAAGVTMFALPQLEQHSATFATRVNGQIASDNISGRFATYRQGLEMFRSTPLVGVGVNRYHDVATARAPEFVAGVRSLPYAHSSFVAVLAEQGLLGFVPLIALTFATWAMIRALRRRSQYSRDDGALLGTAVGAAAAYLVMSLTLTMLPYGPSNGFFALLLGMVAARVESSSSGNQGSDTSSVLT